MMLELGVTISSIGVSNSTNYLEVHLYIKQQTHMYMIAIHAFGEACKTVDYDNVSDSVCNVCGLSGIWTFESAQTMIQCVCHNKAM